jgi:uncharacterized membrane protein YhaH (DUF805 family)
MMIFNSIKDASRKSFVYRGRSERLEHWSFVFFTALCVALITAANRFLGSINQFPINWIVLIVGVWLVLANISLMVRRLHDHNFSGFLLFLPLMCFTVWIFSYDQFTNFNDPVITQSTASTMMNLGRWSLISSCMVFLSFFSRPGDKKENRYGHAI